MHIKGTD